MPPPPAPSAREGIDLQAALGKMARLLDASVTLHGTRNRHQLARLVCDTAADLLLCERCALLICTPQGFRIVGATATDAAVLRRIGPYTGPSIEGAIFRQNRPLSVRRLAHVPTPSVPVEAGLIDDPATLVGVPLRNAGTVMGVLVALNKFGGPFDPSDRFLLGATAAQAAVALHNASLFAEVKASFAALSEKVYPRLEA